MSIELHIQLTDVWTFDYHDLREIRTLMITDTYKARYHISKPHNLPLNLQLLGTYTNQNTYTAKIHAIVELWTQP